MIEEYPNYSDLNVSHSDMVQKFTSGFDPYSDFNFLSLFAWNINHTTAISTLNDNLVIVLPHYITGKPIMSILGTNKIHESIDILLRHTTGLRLVPAVVKESLNGHPGLLFTRDIDNYDYIYDLNDHAVLNGGKYKGLRKTLNKFIRTYGSAVHVQKLDLSKTSKIVELIDVYNQWYVERRKVEDEVINERKAIQRILEAGSHFNLECYEILVNDTLAGFSINEVLPNKYATCHFQKCLLSYDGIDVFLTNYVAKELLKSGCKYINWEQDLGIEGLKTLKQGYKPVNMLEKYIVRAV